MQINFLYLLECLWKEETLLHVIMAFMIIVNISNARIAAIYSAVFFQCLKRDEEGKKRRLRLTKVILSGFSLFDNNTVATTDFLLFFSFFSDSWNWDRSLFKNISTHNLVSHLGREWKWQINKRGEHKPVFRRKDKGM